MFTCERCGAELPLDREQCAYCGTVSAPARQLLQQEAARRAHDDAQHAGQVAIARQKLLGSTEQAASKALMWGLLSVVFFCLPIFNVLSLVAFKKAQASAKEAAAPTPTRAVVGLVCAAFTGILCVVCWVWMITDIRADSARMDARKTELAKQIAAHTDSATLDHPLACALAEQQLLINGFDTLHNTEQFRDVICAGAVRIVGSRAELPDFKFKPSSSGEQRTISVCFKRGEHWFVEDARAVACDLK